MYTSKFFSKIDIYIIEVDLFDNEEKYKKFYFWRKYRDKNRRELEMI